ncbi:MAG: MtrAB system accessory lipoprotein LpqB [Mycobacteriaceae bacterium]
MSRIRGMACLAAVAVALAGCAAVPTDSAPHVIGSVGAQASPQAEQAPIVGREPDLLVRDFISASSSQRSQHRAARQYLTADGSKNWDDGASTTVLTNLDTLYDSRSADKVTILLRADRVGRLSATGSYDVSQGSYEARMTLVRVDGQWRIVTLPSGVVLDRSDFLAGYQRLPVYFLNPELTKVVPDPRWVARDADSVAARLVELLIGGASPQLVQGVESELGKDVRLRSNVTTANGAGVPAVGGSGGVSIDFGGVDKLDATQRQLLAAQVVWTLDAAQVRGPYVLKADGAPLDEKHPRGWDTTDVASTDPSSSPGADVGLHAIDKGALVKVTDSGVAAVAGPLGQANSLLTAAISNDGQQVAAVSATPEPASGSRVQLLVGGLGGLTAATAASGNAMTRPSWSSDARAVWVAVDGTTVIRAVREPTTGQVSSSSVDVGSITSLGGPITALRLSRDGVRAGLVVGGQVYVAVVTRSQSGGVALISPKLVAPGLADTAVSLDWSSAGTLVLAVRSDDSPVVTVGVDGAQVQALPSRNLSPPVRVVSASPGGSLIVADSRGVLQLNIGDAPVDRYWREIVGLSGDSNSPILPG